MKKFLGLLSLLYIVFFHQGCITQVDETVPRAGGLLVIEGRFTNQAEGDEVRISRTSDRSRISEPVGGATVTVEDTTAGVSYPFIENETGVYEINRSAMGSHVYRLKVELDGATYYSSFMRMPTVTTVDSSYLELGNTFEEPGTGEIFGGLTAYSFTHTQAPPQEELTYYMWEVEGVYEFRPTDFPDPFNDIPPPCYIYENISQNNFQLYTHPIGEPLDVRLKTGNRKIDKAFLWKYIFSVYSYSITKESFDFWSQVKELLKQNEGIFTTPPAALTGNLYQEGGDEEVLGFF